MTPAPFTNGADLHTDWFFEFFINNCEGSYSNKRDEVIFRYGIDKEYFRAGVHHGKNAAYIEQMTGDYSSLDVEELDSLIKQLCEGIGEDNSDLVYQVVSKPASFRTTLLFFYKD